METEFHKGQRVMMTKVGIKAGLGRKQKGLIVLGTVASNRRGSDRVTVQPDGTFTRYRYHVEFWMPMPRMFWCSCGAQWHGRYADPDKNRSLVQHALTAVAKKGHCFGPLSCECKRCVNYRTRKSA